MEKDSRERFKRWKDENGNWENQGLSTRASENREKKVN